ncbi:CD44 antigen [Ictalurus furcatus]|uniref:CD44 antigen n=1 Tax=Ictalurus furcatus TaxID=66913 RepID=UPI002350134B|nr:CD44 antigen [Ictalurus furcatus]
MWILLLGLTSGLLASSWASSVQEVKLRSCSYAGVFHIQGNYRYALDFEAAKKLCEVLGTTLASNEEVTIAHGRGLESCRYGWISSGNITISRQVPNALCAANMTGVITLVPTDSHYDAYCYNQTDLSNRSCNFEIKSVENDPAHPETSENSGSQVFNSTRIPAEHVSAMDSVELHTSRTVTAVHDLTPATEETNPTANNSHDEPDVSGDVLDQNTQPPTTTTEPSGKYDDLTTESAEFTEKNREVAGNTPIIFSQVNTGSGMGEAIHTTTSEPNTEGSKDTQEDHINYTSESPPAPTTEVNSRQSVQSKGRKGPGIASSPEENTSSGGTKDWLVILIVIVAIVAIIILGALVVTRNRWCGRSQTLMITSKSSGEGNGTAASAASPEAQEREQEMVTLMNKEKIQENGNTEEFTVITLEESPEKNQEA